MKSFNTQKKKKFTLNKSSRIQRVRFVFITYILFKLHVGK